MILGGWGFVKSEIKTRRYGMEAGLGVVLAINNSRFHCSMADLLVI
jgi:hypothetical protein